MYGDKYDEIDQSMSDSQLRARKRQNIINHIWVVNGIICHVLSSVIQGDIFGPILFSKQVDTIGQECLDDNKYTYMYKGLVEIPPLGMVDDLICVSECGFQSARMNSYINFKTNSKKIQFGISKCNENTHW